MIIEKKILCSLCFPFIYNLYTQIRRIDALELFQDGSFQQIYMCPSKRVNSTNSRTGNLRNGLLKTGYHYIFGYWFFCSVFILVWFRFLYACLCNIYCMIVIFTLEIEGYWNNRLAQRPGGAPDTRVTYKVRWLLGSYHVVMSLQEALPLQGSHDASRSVWTDAVILLLKVLLLWQLLWGPDTNQHGRVLQHASWLSI